MLKSNLFNAVETIPCVHKKARWALQWCDANNTSLFVVDTLPVEFLLFAFGSKTGVYVLGLPPTKQLDITKPLSLREVLVWSLSLARWGLV